MMALMLMMRTELLMILMSMALSRKRRKALWITQYHWSAPLTRGEGGRGFRARGAMVGGIRPHGRAAEGTSEPPQATETLSHCSEAGSR